MIVSQNCIDFDTKTYRFGHFSGPSYRGAHAGWPAGWLVGWLAGWLGHQNASKTRTLRQKVDVEAFQILQILGHQNASSAEGGRRRDEPGKENVELKNCIALVVI